ncbi:hypothetical protein SRHO_G00197780 [Serrasalmus rhombeus]
MTKLDRLNSFLSERLTAALNEIIYTVSMTMKEYEEETARIRKENDHLKEMLTLKVTACSVTEASPDVMVFSLPGGQEDCNSSLEQKSEPQESQNEHWQQKEENSCIKTEQPSYSATQPDCTVVPLQCTSPLNAQPVDQEMMHYELTEIKVESADSNSYSETTDDMDRTESTDSTEQWDKIFSEKSNLSRVHQASSRWPCAVKGVRFKESASQKNRPMEFRPVFSISNQILCNNKQHCTSRQCEMHKTIPKSSPVWRYFSLKEGDCSKAVCLICKAVISRGIKEYTTSALLRHLRGKHGKC